MHFYSSTFQKYISRNFRNAKLIHLSEYLVAFLLSSIYNLVASVAALMMAEVKARGTDARTRDSKGRRLESDTESCFIQGLFLPFSYLFLDLLLVVFSLVFAKISFASVLIL